MYSATRGLLGGTKNRSNGPNGTAVAEIAFVCGPFHTNAQPTDANLPPVSEVVVGKRAGQRSVLH
jgi:hypothetical protein